MEFNARTPPPMKGYICRQMAHFKEITSTIAMQEFQSNSPKKS